MTDPITIPAWAIPLLLLAWLAGTWIIASVQMTVRYGAGVCDRVGCGARAPRRHVVELPDGRRQRWCRDCAARGALPTQAPPAA